MTEDDRLVVKPRKAALIRFVLAGLLLMVAVVVVRVVGSHHGGLAWFLFGLGLIGLAVVGMGVHYAATAQIAVGSTRLDYVGFMGRRVTLRRSELAGIALRNVKSRSGAGLIPQAIFYSPDQVALLNLSRSTWRDDDLRAVGNHLGLKVDLADATNNSLGKEFKTRDKRKR